MKINMSFMNGQILLACVFVILYSTVNGALHDINTTTAPSFTTPLTDSILLCEHNTSITPLVSGYNISFLWTVNGARHIHTDPWLNLNEEDLLCESDHEICVTVTNTAGTAHSCATFFALKMQSIFHKTPSPKDHPHSMWLSGTTAVFRVEITPEICTNHTWWINDRLIATHESLHSNIKLNISTDLQDAELYVLARCGNTVVKSKPYGFKSVSTLTIFGLVMIVVSIVVVVGAGVILLVVFRSKQKSNKYDEEEELQSLVVRDKTKEEAEWIIQTTKYTWSPSMEYLFKSIDKLPFSVHASQFSAISKPEDKSIGHYTVRTDVIFTRKKSMSNESLNEPLIGGTKIDLYVPLQLHGSFNLDPPSIILGSTTVSVGLSATMASGSKVCLLVVCEQLKIYSMLEFKLKI